VTVPVAGDRVRETAATLRRLLEKRTTNEYLIPARQLYDWLIRPLEGLLAGSEIDTLVAVPDGPLLAIPLAALSDGQHFLIERYALAVTPGLTLVDPRPLPREDVEVLAGGLTEAVQGFAALPQVDEEIAAVRSLYGASPLENSAFRTGRLEAALRRRSYTIVHLASHGEFLADAHQSFILTFDGRLTMDALETMMKYGRFRARPVELLTLSACSTAVGDERAALGLAGVAVKAGARGALATIWSVSDPSSARLIAEFYRGLGDPKASKAAALQGAQRALLQDPRYRHPYYWAPFLLIGNWL
jgi:CHAT domain-containing protein